MVTFKTVELHNTWVFQFQGDQFVKLFTPIPSQIGWVEHAWNAVNLETGTFVFFRDTDEVEPILVRELLHPIIITSE